MEILPKNVGMLKIDPTPDRKVVVTFTELSLVLRVSSNEAIEYGRRFIQCGEETR